MRVAQRRACCVESWRPVSRGAPEAGPIILRQQIRAVMEEVVGPELCHVKTFIEETVQPLQQQVTSVQQQMTSVQQQVTSVQQQMASMQQQMTSMQQQMTLIMGALGIVQPNESNETV